MIEESIYDYALVVLINPREMEDWPHSSAYLQPILMTDQHRQSIFQGAMIVIFMQLLIMWLLYQMMVIEKSIKTIASRNFYILVPRLIASFFMHSTLEPYVYKGVATMKYVVNHSYLFKTFDGDDDFEYDEEDEDSEEEYNKKENKYGSSHYINLTLAFLLGFWQFLIAVILEIISLFYLSGLGSFVFILVCYGTIGTVASFEKTYAASLKENPIKGAIGKKLFVKYKRYMGDIEVPWNCMTEGCKRYSSFSESFD